MTCEVWFYHLERSGLEQVLPELLEKTLQRGWRAAVRTTDAEREAHLDSWLWSYRADSFLPHGRADEPGAERQPVLVTTSDEIANAADALFLVDGAEPAGLDGLQRCIVLFDGNDAAALAQARALWVRIKALGAPQSYWRQLARGWEKQA